MEKKRPKLKKRVKRIWLEALRSGDYDQGQGRLRTSDRLQGATPVDKDNPEDSYCCLGVLEDLYLKEKGLTWTPPLATSGAPTIPVFKWAFLKSSFEKGEPITSGMFDVPRTRADEQDTGIAEEHVSLIELNDDAKRSFLWIATRIERYL